MFVLSVVMMFLTLGVWSSSSYATTTGAGTIMKVTADTTNYSVGEEFIVNVEIDNPQDYYAGDISIEYDNRLLELKGVGVADTEQLRIYGKTNTTTSAGTRIIVASNGAEHGMKSDQKVLRLRFVALREGTNGYIRINNARVADGYGREYSLQTIGTTINVGRQTMPDTNGDGRVSLGDLAIASRMLGTNDWENYQPDVNFDGRVTDVDLNKIVYAMMK
jgi:hypothetical protein